MTISPAERTQQILNSGDRAAWLSAALAVALDISSPNELRSAALEVLRSGGIDVDPDAFQRDRGAVAAQAAAPLLQSAALLRGDDRVWADQPDQALLAQGRASAQGAAALRQIGIPMMPGLAEALAAPGARILDVGTGVAALAIAYAEQFPAVTVVGLDIDDHVLELAAATVQGSDVSDRVVLRRQDVSTLNEPGTYALAWLPAPFIPEPALRSGAHRIAAALAPGGWIVLGHGKYTGDMAEDSINRFKTAAYGGTSLDEAQAQALLRNAGFTDVMTAPTPPGAPAITIGRTSR
jgi:predicted O-methyltransferase YrrM